MPRALEYLADALAEAEAAAHWYAERSPSAALAFSEELDAAESAIARLPDAWPPYEAGRADTYSADFRSVSFIGSSQGVS